MSAPKLLTSCMGSVRRYIVWRWVPTRPALNSGSALRPTCTRNAAEIVAIQIDQIEDALFVELVGIVELPGNDPLAAGQRVNEAIGECPVIQAQFAAVGNARVISREGSKMIDKSISLG